MTENKTTVEFFALHLAGGGADLSCGDCLEMARAERLDELVSVARTAVTPGEVCGWCGA